MYVAVKISVSEFREASREVEVLRALAALQPEKLQSQYLVQLLDHFQLDGLNGTHDCLVLKLVGLSVADVVNDRIRDERLPGRLAKHIA